MIMLFLHVSHYLTSNTTRAVVPVVHAFLLFQLIIISIKQHEYTHSVIFHYQL